MTSGLLALLFILAILLVAYTYVGYPLVIARYARPEQRREVTNAPDFAVTIIMSAYNAAHLLPRRIENLLQQNYPAERLSIIIIDDGSTDGTDELLQQYRDHPQIQLAKHESNRGKAAALNLGLAMVKTELVAFTDTRQTFAPDAIAVMAENFVEPNVGAVTGNLVFRKPKGVDPQGGYWDLEKSIRENESRYRSTVGVTGAVYMARRALIEDIPEHLILDDVLIPMRIVKQGYRIKFATDAIAYDDPSANLMEEYYRKVRTLAGNWQLIAEAPWLLSSAENPVFFEFVSHKFLRLLAPWALAISLACAWFLRDLAFFYVVLMCQITLISLAGIGFLLYLLKLKVPILSQLASFAMLNVAALVGTWKFFFGQQKNLWRSH